MRLPFRLRRRRTDLDADAPAPGLPERHASSGTADGSAFLSSGLRAVLPLVEGLGDNCELGFLLGSHGLERGFLLRFALLSVDDLIRFLHAADRRAFAFEDLVPYSKTMVRDRATGIAFHSRMHSVRTDDGWRFETSETDRRALYPDEKSKHDFLLERFERELGSNAPRVYVIKANEGLSDERVAALDAALRAWRRPDSFVLLAVGTDPEASDGTPVLDWRSDTVCRARVSWLAPYHRARDIDEAGWRCAFEKLAGTSKVQGWTLQGRLPGTDAVRRRAA